LVVDFGNAFTPDGGLLDPEQQALLADLVSALVERAGAEAPPVVTSSRRGVSSM
jgi:hypothetical protein